MDNPFRTFTGDVRTSTAFDYASIKSAISSSPVSRSEEERLSHVPIRCTTWPAPRSGRVIRLTLPLVVADFQGQCDVHCPGCLAVLLNVSYDLDEVGLRNLAQHHIVPPCRSDRTLHESVRVPRPIVGDLQEGNEVCGGT